MPGARKYSRPKVRKMPYRAIGAGAEALVVEKLTKSGEPRKPRVAIKIFKRLRSGRIDTRKMHYSTIIANLLFPGIFAPATGSRMGSSKAEPGERGAKLLVGREAPRLKMRLVEGVNPELEEYNRRKIEHEHRPELHYSGPESFTDVREMHDAALRQIPGAQKLIGELQRAGIVFDAFPANIGIAENRLVVFDTFGVEPEKVLRYVKTHRIDERAKNRVLRLLEHYKKL